MHIDLRLIDAANISVLNVDRSVHRRSMAMRAPRACAPCACRQPINRRTGAESAIRTQRLLSAAFVWSVRAAELRMSGDAAGSKRSSTLRLRLRCRSAMLISVRNGSDNKWHSCRRCIASRCHAPNDGDGDALTRQTDERGARFQHTRKCLRADRASPSGAVNAEARLCCQ